MAQCGNCGNEPQVIRIDNGDGTFTYLPVSDNIITIPHDPETPFEAIEGNGITIAPAGDFGHAPIISVCVGTGLQIDDDGCVATTGEESPDWTTVNAEAASGGIIVFPGGIGGHSPQFAIALDPASSAASITDGRLLIECCDDIPWQSSVGSAGISIVPGDNPNGATGNGHRPEFSILVDGTSIGFNTDGRLTVLDPAMSTPCDVTAGTYTGTTSGAFVDGCEVIDLAGASDPETVAAAATFPEFWRQTFTNGVTGSEVWTVLNDVNGAPQWHQVA